MSATSSKLVEVGVVLQGGGALGAYECGALNALLELMDEFAADGREIVLKVVTGVSIGSINAACVVGAKSHADARGRLDALWDDLMLEAPPFWMAAAQRDLAYFGLPGFYTPRPDFWTAPTWTYVYDTRPLLATLGRARGLRGAQCKFDDLHCHRSGGGDRRVAAVRQPAARSLPATKIEPRHVLASGSLPPGFPWTEIDGMPYWDGGIVDNTPLGLAIDAFSTDPAVDRMLVVMNFYPVAGAAAAQPRRRSRTACTSSASATACVRITTPRGASMRWSKPSMSCATSDRTRRSRRLAQRAPRRGAALQDHRRDRQYRHAGSGRRARAVGAASGRRQGWDARFLSGDRAPPAPRRVQVRARHPAARVREPLACVACGKPIK